MSAANDSTPSGGAPSPLIAKSPSVGSVSTGGEMEVGGEAVRDQGNWLMIIVLALIYTCAFVDRQVLSLLVEPIKADLGISDVQMSLLLGLAFSLFYGILNVPAGYLVDRFGRRGLIGTAALVWSAMTMVGGLAVNFSQLFLARAGVGIAEAVITPASFSLIRDRVPPARRARAFSVLGMAPYLGSSIALSGGAALLAAAQAGVFADWPIVGQLRPWQVALFIIGLAGIPLPLLLLFLKRDIRAPYRSGDATPAAGFADAWHHVRQHGAIYLALVAYVTLGAAIAFGKSAWTPAFMARGFHLSTAEIGYTLGPLALASGVTGLFISGWVIDRAIARGDGIIGIAAFIMLGCMIFSAVPQLADTPTMAWTFFAIGNLFSGSFYSVGATMLARVTPSALMGKITAIYLFFQGVVGSAFGPMIVALLSDRLFHGSTALGHALVAYYLGAGALSLIALFSLRRSLGRSQNGLSDD